MTRSLLSLPLTCIVLIGCEGLGTVRTGINPTTSTSPDNRPAEIRNLTQFPHRDLCPDTGVPGAVHCMAKVRTDADGNTAVQQPSSIQGLAPTDLVAAYNVPAGGSGITVAIVDAQDNPSAEADLAVYRAQWGLPPCTTANGCFRKVNESGQQSNYPAADQGWAGEIALDLDMVSAVCPACHILLVEATSATQDDLGAAVNTAVSLGAAVVSNSYGGGESSNDSTYDSQYFNHPGVAITASAGDNGYGVEYPAASPFVTAVGGTSLAQASSNSRGWVEAAWGSANNAQGGTGSGCSSYSSKPSWQSDPSCSGRTVADISAVADPNTGVAVYDQYGSGGWVVVGGTSAASPVVASILAVSGHTADALGFSYSNASDFYDVTTGVNGTCSTGYFCQAGSGYDGPTGNGTPNASAMAGVPAASGGGGSSGTGSGGGSSSSSSSSSSGSSSGGAGGSSLQDGVGDGPLSGAAGSQQTFSFDVPSGVSQVVIGISGGTGDVDLYVSFGNPPSLSGFDCRPYVTGNNETCTLPAQAGTYEILLNGYTDYAGVTLLVSYQ